MLFLKKHSLLRNLLLLLLAALTSGLLWSMLTAPQKKNNLEGQNYDAFATDVVTTKFSERGTKQYELYSPHLTHYKTNNQTRAETPKLTMFTSQQESWLITAQYALATQGTTLIEFIHHVDLSGEKTRNHKNTRLLTEKINYYPEKNIANTDLPVDIVQPGSSIHATGMEIAFNTNTITLLSHINGSYDPNVS